MVSRPEQGPRPVAQGPRFPAKNPRFPAQWPADPTPRATPRQAARTGVSVPQGQGLDSEAVRQRMVDKLRAGAHAGEVVLQAIKQVPRHVFVDSALAPQAYEDTSLPIGMGQTISKPSVVARMLDLLLAGRQTLPGRVLEIGTGCGYQAAVLAGLASEVYSIERIAALHEKARHNLRHLRLRNLHLLLGDGMQGYVQGAPYSGIIAAAGGASLPPAWLEQLAVGGRLIAPTQTEKAQQALWVIDKTPQGLRHQVLEAVHFVPLKSGVQSL